MPLLSSVFNAVLRHSGPYFALLCLCIAWRYSTFQDVTLLLHCCTTPRLTLPMLCSNQLNLRSDLRCYAGPNFTLPTLCCTILYYRIARHIGSLPLRCRAPLCLTVALLRFAVRCFTVALLCLALRNVTVALLHGTPLYHTWL